MYPPLGCLGVKGTTVYPSRSSGRVAWKTKDLNHEHEGTFVSFTSSFSIFSQDVLNCTRVFSVHFLEMQVRSLLRNYLLFCNTESDVDVYCTKVRFISAIKNSLVRVNP